MHEDGNHKAMISNICLYSLSNTIIKVTKVSFLKSTTAITYERSMITTYHTSVHRGVTELPD